MTKSTGYQVVRLNGETECAEIIDTAPTAELARERATAAKQDAKIARPGNSDSFTVRSAR